MAEVPPTIEEQVKDALVNNAEVIAEAQAEIEAKQKEEALDQAGKELSQENERWQEQCVLQANMQTLSELRKKYQRDYQYIDVFETDNNHSPTENKILKAL